MTTSASGRSATAACDGVTVAFAVPFQCPPPTSALLVYLLDDAAADNADGILLSEGVHYSVSGDLAAGAAEVITATAYPEGKYLRRWRETSLAQGADYVPAAGPFPAAATEGQLDRLSLVDEETGDDAARLERRALKVPAGATAPALSAPADYAGKAVVGNGDGSAFVPVSLGDGNDPGLRDDLASSLAGALLIAWKAAGIGAVLRTLWARIADLPVSVKDFGATGLGVADDAAAIQAAITAHADIVIPAGSYKIGTGLTVPSSRRIRGAGKLTRLVKSAVSVGRVFTNSDTAGGNIDIEIRDLLIDGAYVSGAYAPGRDALLLTRCSGCVVDNVTAEYCGNDGIIIEYGQYNQVQNCTARYNAKSGIYFSGAEDVTMNGCIAHDNGTGGFQIAATWWLVANGNQASFNTAADLLIGRDSRHCDIEISSGSTIQNAVFVTAEPVGDGITPVVLHGVTYPGSGDPDHPLVVYHGCQHCSIRGVAEEKISLTLFDDGLIDFDVLGPNSQGIVLFGSSRNTIRGTVLDWTAGYAALQFVDYTAGDGAPAANSPPISSDDNDYSGLIIKGSGTHVSDTGTDNIPRIATVAAPTLARTGGATGNPAPAAADVLAVDRLGRFPFQLRYTVTPGAATYQDEALTPPAGYEIETMAFGATDDTTHVPATATPGTNANGATFSLGFATTNAHTINVRGVLRAT